MKAIIFAGGSGKRFWPISRNKMPKQFISLIDSKSTFQMQVERVKDLIGLENIFVSTNENYVKIVKDQVPELPTTNIIAEPDRKDLLAALGYAMIRMKKMGVSDTVVYLAADHLIKNLDVFRSSIRTANQLVQKNKNRFVYFGEKPLYPTNNLGWIHIGDEIKTMNKVSVCKYKEWIYRPDIELCKKMFKKGSWLWNINYEAFDIDFALKKYKENFPRNYKKLLEIEESIGTRNESTVTNKVYASLDEAHSDELWKSATPDQAVVLSLDMGWSDPGTLFVLKQTLEKSPKDNVTKGSVHVQDTSNSLLYNLEKDKLVAVLGMEGVVVVNMDDVLLVVDKDKVRFLSEMLAEFKGTKLEKYL